MQVTAILRSVRRFILTPPSTNYLFRKIDPAPYDSLPPQPLILDIGSKDARGRYAFGDPPQGSRVLCVDIEDAPGVDVVADAQNLHMFPNDSVDCVVSVSTLEHVRDPFAVVAEIHRILKPGGIIYLSIPFIFAFHGDPDDITDFPAMASRFCAKNSKLSTAVSTAALLPLCVIF